jgi:hypothetical protein
VPAEKSSMVRKQFHALMPPAPAAAGKTEKCHTVRAIKISRQSADSTSTWAGGFCRKIAQMNQRYSHEPLTANTAPSGRVDSVARSRFAPRERSPPGKGVRRAQWVEEQSRFYTRFAASLCNGLILQGLRRSSQPTNGPPIRQRVRSVLPLAERLFCSGL